MAESSMSLLAAAGQFLAAVRAEDVDGALTLMQANPGLTAVSLHASAAVCDPVAVRDKLAVDPGSAVRRLRPSDVPPICYAVQPALRKKLGVSDADQLETVRLLLDAGADPNSTMPLPDVSEGIPVLYFPCVSNDVALARLLLERGANPSDGESLFHAAQHDHRDCLELLRSFGADLSGPHAATGNTALHFLAGHTANNPIAPQAMRGMEWLLANGADPNVLSDRSASGASLPGGRETPLVRAAASGHGPDVLRTLVEHGAVVDAARDDARTAYVMALRIGNDDAAAYLESVGADVTRMQPVDQLLYACALADLGAARAVLAEHPGLLGTLSDEDRRAVVRAVSGDQVAQLAVMLAIGFPLDAEDEWGGTPLHVACWNGRVSLARLLLAHDAPVNVRDSRYGSAPLAWTAHGSRFSGKATPEEFAEIAALLLDAGATRDASFNRWHESPESFGHPAVVAVLQERGFLSAHPAG